MANLPPFAVLPSLYPLGELIESLLLGRVCRDQNRLGECLPRPQQVTALLGCEVIFGKIST